MSFSSLKKKANDFDTLREKIGRKQHGNNSETFVVGTDPANNGYARVRWLPAKDDVNHIVSYSKFKFKVGTKAYEAKSRASIGLDDPCQEYLRGLWNLGTEEAKKLYKERKKKNINVGWIYCYEDRKDPSNNGTVKKFYMPHAAKVLVENAIDPEEDEFETTPDPFNPFDIFGDTGRDFILRVKDKDSWKNYGDSKFVDTASPWWDSDEQMKEFEKLWEDNVKDLTDVLKEDSFKSYDDLLKMLVEVIGYDDPVLLDVHGDKIEELRSGESHSPSNASRRKKEEPAKAKPKAEEEDTSTDPDEEEVKPKATKKAEPVKKEEPAKAKPKAEPAKEKPKAKEEESDPDDEGDDFNIDDFDFD